MSAFDAVRELMVASGMPSDDLEDVRRRGGEVWSTEDATEAFTFIGFAAPFVLVIRKADKARGTLEFTHRPRWYFDFQVTEGA